MKKTCLLLGVLALLPGTALAQSYDEPTFSGVKVGVSVDRRTLDADYELPKLDAQLDEDRTGFGYRGHIGYDVQIGNALLVGVEGASVVADVRYRRMPGSPTTP